MTSTRTTLGWQVASAVLLTLTSAWMLAPTYAIAVGVDPALMPDGLVTRHSWVDPFLLAGAAQFTALPAALCALIGAVVAWLAVPTGRTGRAPAWWALTGAAFTLGSQLFSAVGWGPWVALVLLVAGAATGLLAARRALPPVLSEQAGR